MEHDIHGRLDRGEWIEASPGRRIDEETTAAREPVTWYVHRDGLVEAASFADGRAPAFFVVGQGRPYPTQAEARQVLARSH